MKIESVWTRENGKWHEKLKKFISRVSTTQTKEIEMVIEKRGSDKLLRFIGGPTGFECYYIADLLVNNKDDKTSDVFCICGGTINSWPRCEVSWEKVYKFITQNP